MGVYNANGDEESLSIHTLGVRIQSLGSHVVYSI